MNFPVASDPSTSIVERRWDPVSLLRRTISPQQFNDAAIRAPPATQLKSPVLRLYTDNPVVKSLFTKPTILDRGADVSHRAQPALAKRGEETKTTDYTYPPPPPSTGSQEAPKASEPNLMDPNHDSLTLTNGNEPKADDKAWYYGRVFYNKAVDEVYGRKN
ncbi:MAG: hypothetical protein L6R42_007122 [Xanthoria sp. 1 TBL-2021]|nr:MAG: hypothetical protein L6R42_007122 [Xanthoria sp. 1 TBL-2021]